jgi:hypothetical protein
MDCSWSHRYHALVGRKTGKPDRRVAQRASRSRSMRMPPRKTSITICTPAMLYRNHSPCSVFIQFSTCTFIPRGVGPAPAQQRHERSDSARPLDCHLVVGIDSEALQRPGGRFFDSARRWCACMSTEAIGLVGMLTRRSGRRCKGVLPLLSSESFKVFPDYCRTFYPCAKASVWVRCASWISKNTKSVSP